MQSLSTLSSSSSPGLGDTAEGKAPTSTASFSNSPPLRKQIAQSACELCRKKRTRCVVEPDRDQCNNCRAFQVNCVFSGVDRRKESVKEMRSRLAYLECRFERLRHCKDDTDMREEWKSFRESEPNPSDLYTSEVLGRRGSEFEDQKPNAKDPKIISGGSHKRVPSFQSSVSSSSEDSEDPNNCRNGSTAHTSWLAGLPATAAGSNAVSHTDINEDTNEPDEDSAGPTENLSELVDRVTISTDGSIHAYGATSNLAFSEDAMGMPVSPDDQWTGNGKPFTSCHNPSLEPEPTSRSSTHASTSMAILPQGTDIQTAHHLLYLYFLWHHPAVPVFSRPVFIRHLRDGGKYASPLLLNAILALGSMFCNLQSVRTNRMDPCTAGDSFFSLAKELLEVELEKPTISTVQALCIMACHEALCARELRGWLYIGQASRLAMDFGLHLDVTSLAQEGVLDEEDLYVRSRTFWALWQLDREYTALMGRPSCLNGFSITCPRPGNYPDEDFDWLASHQCKQIVPLRSGQPLQLPSEGTIFIGNLMLDLADCADKGGRLIYSQKTMNKKALLQALTKNMQITRSHIQQLPPVIYNSGDHSIVRSGQLPGLISVHILYRSQIIRMNHPLTKLEGVNQQFEDGAPGKSKLSTDGDSEKLASPRTCCLEAAKEMIYLFSLYRENVRDGLRTTLAPLQHALRSALTVLIMESFATAASPRHRSPQLDTEMEGQRLLEMAFGFLDEMSVFRPAARKGLENIRRLLQEKDKQKRSSVDRPEVAVNPIESGHSHLSANSPRDVQNSSSGVWDPAFAKSQAGFPNPIYSDMPMTADSFQFPSTQTFYYDLPNIYPPFDLPPLSRPSSPPFSPQEYTSLVMDPQVHQ